MKVFAFLVSLLLFLGGMALFGYAFDAAEGWHAIVFAAGIAAISVSLMVPFHLLGRSESN
jgi:hypothetical protein